MTRKTLISQAALSRLLKCSRSTISGLAAKGMPHRTDGQLDRSAALQWIVDSTTGSGGGWDADHGRVSLRERAQAILDGAPVKSAPVSAPPAKAPASPGSESRADLEHELLRERIKKERLANKERDHSLVDLSKVNAWVAGMITRAAGILDRIPAELGDRLSQISDPIACQKLLKAEIDRARHELAQYRA